MKKYISVAKAAEQSSRNVEEWSLLCEAGLVEAQWHSDGWYFDESALHENFDTELALLRQRQKVERTTSTARDHHAGVLSKALASTIVLIGVSGFVTYAAQTGMFDFSLTKQVAAPVMSAATSSNATSTATTTATTTTPESKATIGSMIDQWLADLADLFSYIRDRIIQNWQGFLGVAPDSEMALGDSSTNATSSSQLEQLVDQRVNAALQAILKNSSGSTGKSGAPSGVVVVPTSGSPATDAAIRARLQNAFSDTVKVQFDSSGISGTIAPVFQSIPNDDYLFMIAPLRH